MRRHQQPPLHYLTGNSTHETSPLQHMQPSQSLQQQQRDAQRMYHFQAQQQQAALQQNAMAAQNRPPNANPMGGAAQTVNPQLGGPVRPPQQPSRQQSADQMMKNLTLFMQSRGLPLNLWPVVGDRTVNLMLLYAVVS